MTNIPSSIHTHIAAHTAYLSQDTNLLEQLDRSCHQQVYLQVQYTNSLLRCVLFSSHSLQFLSTLVLTDRVKNWHQHTYRSLRAWSTFNIHWELGEPAIQWCPFNWYLGKFFLLFLSSQSLQNVFYVQVCHTRVNGKSCGYMTLALKFYTKMWIMV